MSGVNLSDRALGHRSLVWYLIIVSLLAGALSYMSPGREEDPSFAIKTMIISAALPGATAEDTVTQVIDRIEKKLQEPGSLKNTRSVTFPGQAVVYVALPHHSPEPGRFRKLYQRVLIWAIRAKWVTIAVTVAVFGLSIHGMKFVGQQFFPTSDRPELILDVTLRQNAAFAATDQAIAKVETFLATRQRRPSGRPVSAAPRRASCWRWISRRRGRTPGRSSS